MRYERQDDKNCKEPQNTSNNNSKYSRPERGHIALTHNDKNNRANVQTDTNQRQGCDTASCTAASTNKNIGYIVVNFLNWAT